MKMRMLVPIVCLLFVFVSVSYAQIVTVDLGKLDPSARNSVIDANANKNDAPINPESWKQWAEVGKAIGLAIAETAKQLNTEVNAFIKTPAGMIAVGLIAYKIAGHDILTVALGIPF
jgi:hypothetical protein